MRATWRALRAVLVRLNVGRQLYNVCLQIALRRLRRLRASPQWAAVRALPQRTKAEQRRRQRAF